MKRTYISLACWIVGLLTLTAGISGCATPLDAVQYALILAPSGGRAKSTPEEIKDFKLGTSQEVVLKKIGYKPWETHKFGSNKEVLEYSEPGSNELLGFRRGQDGKMVLTQKARVAGADAADYRYLKDKRKFLTEIFPYLNEESATASAPAPELPPQTGAKTLSPSSFGGLTTSFTK